ALLPGEPATGGQDPRWQAVIAVGEYIETEPEAVWSFIRRWGSHPQEDLRDLIATCLLEHLLEHQFRGLLPAGEAAGPGSTPLRGHVPEMLAARPGQETR